MAEQTSGPEYRQEQFERALEAIERAGDEEELSEGPYGGRLIAYRDFMVGRIEQNTGVLYDIGNLSASTLEKVYTAIIKKSPRADFRARLR